ncbi:LPS export ABC transporter permease LptF [Geothermobacter hydrogeniphilus]|uniref:LPS export ABC transporter permease LptF n=1 Tax=Geothermobacter hydrogeniphilus TaxID=1969733 RepID=A0A2K2H8Y9_9BACT|nr:LPS export ABC transporter permease LptF [Geothermobacter hydrogeniphilus]PNU19778.1 LPS export ABC transporter permease LptF [Geothermobacter hydrogeniphilus]
MLMTRIDRYILREIAAPTLLSLLVFTFVLLAGRTLKLARMVINNGVPLKDILHLLVDLLPSFLSITLPLAILLGTLLAFSRLSADAEIIALKASGLSLNHLLRPALIMALTACLVTASLTLYLKPLGYSAFRGRIFKILSQRTSVGLQARVFQTEFPGMVLYADNLDERSSTLEGVFISDQRMGTTPSTIVAESGRFLADPKRQSLTLQLNRGQIHRYPQDSTEDTYQVIDFNNYAINLPLDQVGQPPGRQKVKELSLANLLKRVKTTDSIAEQFKSRAELHHRFSMIPIPLLFALLALPLGIQSNRSGKGGGFAIGLLVYLFYYLATSFAGTLVVEQHWPAALTLWTPPLLFLLLGTVLYRQALHERRLRHLDHLIRLVQGIWRPGRREN